MTFPCLSTEEEGTGCCLALGFVCTELSGSSIKTRNISELAAGMSSRDTSIFCSSHYPGTNSAISSH